MLANCYSLPAILDYYLEFRNFTPVIFILFKIYFKVEIGITGLFYAGGGSFGDLIFSYILIKYN